MQMVLLTASQEHEHLADLVRIEAVLSATREKGKKGQPCIQKKQISEFC